MYLGTCVPGTWVHGSLGTWVHVGRQFLHFDPRARLRLFIQSVCVIVMMVLLVISLITSIFVFKIVNQDKEEAKAATTAALAPLTLSSFYR